MFEYLEHTETRYLPSLSLMW